MSKAAPTDSTIDETFGHSQIHIVDNKRTIFIEGALSDKMMVTVIKSLYEFSFEPKPIVMWVSSLGGDLDATYAIYDVMRLISANGCPITTVSFGCIASAATVLVMGGDYRLGLDSTNFMVHSIEYEFSGAASAGKTFHSMVVRSQEKYFGLLDKNTVKSKDFWRKQIKEKKEYWFGAKEAKDTGLIHTVLDSKTYEAILKDMKWQQNDKQSVKPTKIKKKK